MVMKGLAGDGHALPAAEARGAVILRYARHRDQAVPLER